MSDLSDQDKQDIDEILMGSQKETAKDPDPEWVKEVDEDSEKYLFEIYLSTDGKHTIHCVAYHPKARRNALVKSTETYDYIKTRYGTKQAQAVKEYGKEKAEAKPDQEACSHTEFTFKQSQTEKNPGRWFKSCKACGKFLGWVS